MWATFAIFIKIGQGKQSPIGRKLAQSGHPAQNRSLSICVVQLNFVSHDEILCRMTKFCVSRKQTFRVELDWTKNSGFTWLNFGDRGISSEGSGTQHTLHFITYNVEEGPNVTKQFLSNEKSSKKSTAFGTRATRCVFEKVAQNVAQPFLVTMNT
jgi:hypothetical protein